MELKVIGSSSEGNSYLLYDNNCKCIILDCGLSFSQIKKGLNYDLDCVEACFCTHNHKADHTFSIKDVIKNGIPTYGNDDICSEYKGCKNIGKVVKTESFKVQNFELAHSVPNNCFVCDTNDGFRTLYATDTQYIPKVVKGVNMAIIEANYSEDIIVDNMMNDEWGRSSYKNHQSIEKCIEYLRKIFHGGMQAIVLCHLSDSNSNAEQFKKMVQDALGFENVYIADKGLEINLDKEMF